MSRIEIISDINVIKQYIQDAYDVLISKGIPITSVYRISDIAPLIDIPDLDSDFELPFKTDNSILMPTWTSEIYSLPEEIINIDAPYGFAYAFSGSNVQQVLLPQALSIGFYTYISAFKNCNQLTTVDLSNLESVANSGLYECFYNCTQANCIDLSKLKFVDDYGMLRTFYNSSTESVNLDSLIYLTGQQAMRYCFANNKQLQVFKCPNLVSTASYALGDVCNSCTNLTEIDFSKLRNVGSSTFDYAFTNCGIIHAEFPEIIEMTGSYAFRSAFGGNQSLLSVAFPKLVKLGDTRSSSYYGIFDGCFSNDKNLEIADFHNLEYISGYYICQTMFQGCIKLNYMPFSQLKFVFGDYAMDLCFANTGLDTEDTLWLYVLNDLENIGISSVHSIFSGCSAIDTVDYNRLNNLQLSGSFSGTSVSSADLSGYTNISGSYKLSSAFARCNNITNLNLNNLETAEDGQALGNLCSRANALTNISFPKLRRIGNPNGNQVQNVFYCAFEGTSNLDRLIFPALEEIYVYTGQYAYNKSTFSPSYSASNSSYPNKFYFPKLKVIDYTTKSTTSNPGFVNCSLFCGHTDTQLDTYVAELHFGARHEAEIKSSPGYEYKWGATNANILFDLYPPLVNVSASQSNTIINIDGVEIEEGDYEVNGNTLTYVAYNDNSVAFDSIDYADNTTNTLVISMENPIRQTITVNNSSENTVVKFIMNNIEIPAKTDGNDNYYLDIVPANKTVDYIVENPGCVRAHGSIDISGANEPKVITTHRLNVYLGVSGYNTKVRFGYDKTSSDGQSDGEGNYWIDFVDIGKPISFIVESDVLPYIIDTVTTIASDINIDLSTRYKQIILNTPTNTAPKFNFLSKQYQCVPIADNQFGVYVIKDLDVYVEYQYEDYYYYPITSNLPINVDTYDISSDYIPVTLHIEQNNENVTVQYTIDGITRRAVNNNGNFVYNVPSDFDGVIYYDIYAENQSLSGVIQPEDNKYITIALDGQYTIKPRRYIYPSNIVTYSTTSLPCVVAPGSSSSFLRLLLDDMSAFSYTYDLYSNNTNNDVYIELFNIDPIIISKLEIRHNNPSTNSSYALPNNITISFSNDKQVWDTPIQSVNYDDKLYTINIHALGKYKYMRVNFNMPYRKYLRLDMFKVYSAVWTKKINLIFDTNYSDLSISLFDYKDESLILTNNNDNTYSCEYYGAENEVVKYKIRTSDEYKNVFGEFILSDLDVQDDTLIKHVVCDFIKELNPPTVTINLTSNDAYSGWKLAQSNNPKESDGWIMYQSNNPHTTTGRSVMRVTISGYKQFRAAIISNGTGSDYVVSSVIDPTTSQLSTSGYSNNSNNSDPANLSNWNQFKYDNLDGDEHYFDVWFIKNSTTIQNLDAGLFLYDPNQ